MMSLELENIILTCDSREKNPRRVKAIEEWAVSLGAIVEHSKLDLCDYALVGEFRGLPVNLGVEAKSWDNFLSDKIEDMEDKLVRSQELYDEVAIFIETGNYTFKPQANNHCILDHSNPKLELESKTLAAFEGFCDTLQSNKVHVRQLRSEAQFPYSIYNLLVYLITPHILDKSIRNGTLSKEKYRRWYSNSLASFPQMNTFKRIDKLIEHYPSYEWLSSACEDSLIEVMGRQVGMTLYAYLHYKGFETDEWRGNFHRDGTLRPTESEDKHPDGNPCPVNLPYRSTDIIPSHEVERSPILVPSSTSDTIPSHPGDSITPITKPGDLHPPQMCVRPCDAVKQGKLLPLVHTAFHSPAEIHSDKELEVIGDCKPEYRVLCRACGRIITEDTDTGFCTDSKCIADRQKPTNKMTLKEQIKEYMKDGRSHTMQEIVDAHAGFDRGYVFQHIMGAASVGWLKKVTMNDKVTFQRIL